MKIILIPSFKQKIEKKRYRSHLKVILRLIKKLEKLGKRSIKILDIQDNYLLGEMKVKKPPYRLYVIVNRKRNIFYIVDWEHKNHQENIINKLKDKLSTIIEFGLKNVFI